jgi:hypothetical protein
MSRRASWSLILIGLAAFSAVAIALTRRAKPIDEQIMVADKLEFIGEDFPLDGGSRAFFFHLPRKQYLMLLVVHRRAKEDGGNPDFQEIRVTGYRGSRADVPAESPLETKLIELLRTAVIKTNDVPKYSEPPKPERLLWIVQRMQNRRSKW